MFFIHDQTKHSMVGEILFSAPSWLKPIGLNSNRTPGPIIAWFSTH